MTNEELKSHSDELIRIKTDLWDAANELENDGKKCASKLIFMELEKLHTVAMALIKDNYNGR